MRKVLLLLLLSLTTMLNAQTVSKNVAAQRAAAVFSRNSQSGAKGQTASSVQPKLVYTSEKDGVTCFYVFDNPQGGYAIIGGDEHATQVLASSKTGSFDYDELPPPVQMLLSSYTAKIAAASFANEPVAAKGSSLTASTTAEGVVAGRVDVAPLIKTAWGQRAPFYNDTPTVGGTHCLTGCVATAVAQVLYYLNWPKVDLATPLTKTLTVTDGDAVTLSTKFGTYNWTDASQWKDKYDGTETDQSATNVANLMKDCGILTEMTYGVSASAAQTLKLRTFFKAIDVDALSASFANISGGIDTWEKKIYDELVAKRPVIYAASDAVHGGHCFICDGYNATDNTFHFNWGWNGDCQEAYFSLRPTPNMKAGTWTFSDNHRIVYSIKPNETVAAATSVTVSNGTSSKSKGMTATETADAPIIFNMNDVLQLDFGENGISSGGEDSDMLLFGVILNKLDDMSMAGGGYLIPDDYEETQDMTEGKKKSHIRIILNDIPAGTYQVSPIFWLDEDDDESYAGDGAWEYVDFPEDVVLPVITVKETETTSAKAVQAKTTAVSTDGKYLIDNTVRIKNDNHQYDANGIEIKD